MSQTFRHFPITNLYHPDPGWSSNELADEPVQHRGKFMVRRLTEETKRGEKVFAVAGASQVSQAGKSAESFASLTPNF